MSSKKKVKVFTQNRHFTGQRLSVQFENGIGEASKEQAKLLVNDWGYYCPEISKTKNAPKWLEEEAPKEETPEVEAPEEEAPIEETPEEQVIERPSSKAKNDDLKAFMTDNNIDFEGDDNKADLNAKIDAWLEAKYDEDSDSDEDSEETQTEETDK
ncbi:MAG: hypothetical protein ROO71_09000 [Balneola sp.]